MRALTLLVFLFYILTMLAGTCYLIHIGWSPWWMLLTIFIIGNTEFSSKE